MRTILLIAFPTLAAMGCTSPWSELGRTTPEEIRGEWVCDAPAYADRSFEILEESLIFHTGGETFDIYLILSVRAKRENGTTFYEIDHTGEEGGDLMLPLVFRSADGTIVFQNQPEIVWSRSTTGPEPDGSESPPTL